MQLPLNAPNGGDQPQAFAGTGGPSVSYTPGVTRASGEITANSTTEGNQSDARITSLSNGGFVVTWVDRSGNLPDVDGAAVRAQVFNAAGFRIGSEISVNTTTSGDQAAQQITALSTGGFVITWTDYGADLPGVEYAALRAQVFNANGAPVGGEIQVNTDQVLDLSVPQITALAGGRFVVTWTDYTPGDPDNFGSAIRAQLFDEYGPVGVEFVVNTVTEGDQNDPHITALSTGGFVVTWTDSSATPPDGSETAVRAQVYAANGATVGNEILVNTSVSGSQVQPEITGLVGGGFVVTWQDGSLSPDDPDGLAVRAQVFTAGGDPAGNEILVNTSTLGSQAEAQIAALSGGGFVVTWTNFGQSSSGIQAQVFTAGGSPVGSEITVNTTLQNDQQMPRITGLSNGGFVVTWQDANNGESNVLRAQVFTAAGAPLGAELLVNPDIVEGVYTTFQTNPRITAIHDGGFVVAWDDQSANGVDYSAGAINAQIFHVGLAAVEQVALDLKNTGFTVTDPDADDILTVTLSADFGRLTVTAGTSGVTVSGSRTGSVTLTGTASQIQALLNSDDSSTVSYYANNGPPASTTLTLSVNDGAGGSAMTFVVVPIEDTAESFTPSSGGDTLTGAAGGDTLTGLDGDDIIDGGDGDDTLEGGEGDDALIGGDGADLLKGGLGADAMAGGTGDDTYLVDSLSDTTDETGGDGVDKVRSTLSWTLGTDIEDLELVTNAVLTGTGNSLNNVITGGAGANTLQGLDGGDILYGLLGNDLLEGGNDADALDGGNGNDDLRGGAGVDILLGGLGNDRLDGGSGADILTGAEGSDVYVVDDENDIVIELSGTSTGMDLVEASVSFTLSANVENITLTGSGDISGTGNSLKNVLTGNGGANTLDGDAGDDTISGGNGNDSLIGGAGADILNGNAGNDWLAGGDGADRLTGGTGADTFVFTQADVHLTSLGGKADVDKILDLNFADGDVIDLSGIDAKSGTLVDDAFSFVTKFTKVAGQAVMAYVASSNLTTLQLDVDGDGKADLVVQIIGNHAGTAANTFTGGGDANGGWVL